MSKRPSEREVRQQVELAEGDLRAHVLADLPGVADLIEVAQQIGRRQAALDLELRVDALARLVEHASERSVPTISIFQPAILAANSSRIMASE